MRTLSFLLPLLLLAGICPAQMIGFTEIDPANLSPWRASDWGEYAGVYHFGDSEAETDLLLFIDRGRMCAQIRYSKWKQINGRDTWITYYRNLTEVYVEETRFGSRQHQGKFVIYTDEDGPYPGLRIQNPWTAYMEAGTFEVGLKQGNFDGYIAGTFPQGTTRLLTAEELTSLSSDQLRLMRNEIFARYGHRFRKGGEMEAYFTQQDWYQPQHDDATGFLTLFEKKNIALIQAEEAKR